MNIQMQLQKDLSNLPYMVPGPYTPSEKMPSSSELKKDAVIALWKNIIIEGEGFVGENKSELGEGLKIYLKGRCTLKKIDNFSIFCRQWCQEILPTLKIEEANQIERIYTIFQTLGKENVEADTYGVRNYSSIENELETFLKKCSSISGAYSYFLDKLFSLSLTGPWWTAAICSAFSRYRTARQSLVGVETVAATLKERFANLVPQINSKFNGFKDLQVIAANSLSLDGIVKKENQKTCGQIKEISSKRLSVLALRIFIASVSLFSYIYGAISNSITVKVLSLFIWLPPLIYGLWGIVTLQFQGGLLGGSIGFFEFFANLMYGMPGLAALFYEVTMAMVSAHPIWITFMGIICLLDIIIIIAGTFFREYGNHELHSAFCNAAPWDEANDSLHFLLSRLSQAIDYTLEKLLALIDGDSSAVKIG